MRFKEAIARLPGAQRHHGYYVGFCPCCENSGSSSRSLSVRMGQRGRASFTCFKSQCRPFDIIAALCGSRVLSYPSTLVSFATKRAGSIDMAQRIWDESHPLGHIGSRYLKGRGVPLDLIPTLRFQSELYYSPDTFLPAIVAKVQALDGRLIGVHRTYLAADGRGKAKVVPAKKMLGPCGGGAIRLRDDVDDVLAITEGVESGLSVAWMYRLPVWVAGSCTGMQVVGVPASVKRVIFAIDSDDAGQSERAARIRSAALYHERPGIVCEILRPPAGQDWNDVLLSKVGITQKESISAKTIQPGLESDGSVAVNDTPVIDPQT